MECPDITTLERAEAKLSSSVLPIGGLRRGDDGILTEDARNMVMDGLKSRGVDLSNTEQKTKIIINYILYITNALKIVAINILIFYIVR